MTNTERAFQEIPEAERPLVVERINDLNHAIEMSGGMDMIWLYALTILMCKMHEDMGYEVNIVKQKPLIIAP